MKKSLLALAVLGAFAGAASAQSSVTIYGLLDLAITKGNGGTAPNPGANGTSEAYIMKQSAASRLGFRGNEDMGGGLSAQFQIEHRFTPDDSQAANPFWAGRSFVQVTHAAVGSVYLGREYTPAFWPAVKTDPFGWDGVGQINGNQWALFRSENGAGVRRSNSLGFRSVKFGGVSVQAAVGLAEGSATGRNTGFNVEYAGGPIYAGLGYEKINDGPAAWADNSVVNFGFSYDFGFIKPMLHFANAKTGVGATVKSRNVMFGLTAPIAGGKLKFAYDTVDPNTTVDDNELTKISVGYDYPLSKRTNVYLDFGQGKSEVVGVTTNRAVALGMKHTF